MRDLKNKINKLLKILKLKEDFLRKQTFDLNKLYEEKNEINKKLSLSKVEYLKGLSIVNANRHSSNIFIEVYENGLTYAKNQWVELFKISQVHEKKIEIQKQIVLSAKNKTEQIKFLIERYKLKMNLLVEKAEQNTLDEISQRKYSLNKDVKL